MTKIRVASWNMRVGRSPITAHRDLLRLIAANQPDVLLLQEAVGYVHMLSHIPGWHLVHSIAAGADQTVILVHDDLDHTTGDLIRACDGWPVDNGVPRWFAVVVVEGIRFVDVHVPLHKGRARKRSRQQEMDRLGRYAGAHDGPLVIGGDWNDESTNRGRWTSHHLADSADLEVAEPGKPTHAHHKHPIDKFLTHGVDVTRVWRGEKYGSDHHCVMAEITTTKGGSKVHIYPGADRSQWFGDRYPGSPIDPNVIVLHTTEGSSWPSYSGGADAPNLTVWCHPKGVRIRQHIRLDRSSRALENAAGGVETNTLNCIQIELVGSCAYHDRGIYWPDPPQWAIDQLGSVLEQLHQLYPAIPLRSGLRWKHYPASYGTNNGVRLSDHQWRNFYGICGHQHVPENHHGDPGDIPIEKILAATHSNARQSEEDDMNVDELDQYLRSERGQEAIQKAVGHIMLHRQDDAGKKGDRYLNATLSNDHNLLLRIARAVLPKRGK